MNQLDLVNVRRPACAKTSDIEHVTGTARGRSSSGGRTALKAVQSQILTMLFGNRALESYSIFNVIQVAYTLREGCVCYVCSAQPAG